MVTVSAYYGGYCIGWDDGDHSDEDDKEEQQRTNGGACRYYGSRGVLASHACTMVIRRYLQDYVDFEASVSVSSGDCVDDWKKRRRNSGGGAGELTTATAGLLG